MPDNEFYCACCGRMHSLKEAQVIFKTGFFRSIYPLGYCKNGQHALASREQTANNPAVGERPGDSFEIAVGGMPYDLSLDKPQPAARYGMNTAI